MFFVDAGFYPARAFGCFLPFAKGETEICNSKGVPKMRFKVKSKDYFSNQQSKLPKAVLLADLKNKGAYSCLILSKIR